MNEALIPVAHYRPPDGWLGDVHPLFHNGQWHVYALQVPLEPTRMGLSRLESVDVAGRDLLRWKEIPIHLQDVSRLWWAIANIEAEGRVYSYYNGPQGFDLATSEDARTWTPYAHNPVIPYPQHDAAQKDALEYRDPFVYYDALRNRFLMVVAVRKLNDSPFHLAGQYLYATSKDKIHWSALRSLYDPGGIGVPECPDLFDLNGRYYLLGSWAENRVGPGRYRVADNPEGPWRVPDEDLLDSTEIMAPNTASDGRRRLFFGWIPTYQGGKDFAPFEWGGHLAFPREVYATPEGQLYTRLPDEILALRGKALRPKSKDCELRQGHWSLHSDGLELTAGDTQGVFWLPGEHARFEAEATLTLSEGCERAGFVFRVGDAEVPGYAVTVDLREQKLRLHPVGETERSLVARPIRIQAGTPLKLRVFVDGDIVEAFLDARYSLAGRAHKMTVSQRVGFYAQGGPCRVQRPAIYALKTLYPRNAREPIQLRPPSPPVTTEGASVLFPVIAANVYAPYHPAMDFTGSFTLECRIKITPRTGGYKSNLIVKGDLPLGYEYGLNLTNHGGLEIFFQTPTGFEGLDSPMGTVRKEGQWMHVAGVVDREHNEMRLYCNGRRLAARTLSGAAAYQFGKGALRLACAAGLPVSDPFYGLMDEVRVWACARTETQIRANRQRPLAPTDNTGLILYWNFDDVAPDAAHQERPTAANHAGRYDEIKALLFDGAIGHVENSLP